ncbi:Alcohol dehydrogenase [hydrothermal vent metagenome]|uniref:alcohol dehydrogenase (NADP(+)) n=1 Tax=hydrothermal vent metagenome TaxID=652676 RepID=A0A3B1A870_9ZZZZ
MKIKAYAASEPKGKLKPFEYNTGPLEPDEVEINVHFCGICHSDLSVIDNEWGNTQYPVVPGHEVVGTIAKLGKQVKHLHTGQIVGLGWHSGYCNACVECDAGDHNFCSSAQATIIGHHGGFADKVYAAANSVVPIPEGIDLQSAGPLFCGGVTVFNPLLEYNIKPSDKVAVIGIGGLGHMALQFCNAWGCEVTAFTSNDEKKQQALEIGAHHTLDSRNPEEIKAAAGQFDFIISTVNVKLDWNLYLSTLNSRGRLHFVGATMDPLDINVFSLIGGQHSVSGSPIGSPAAIAKMLEFANRHNIKPIIEKFELEDVNEAIAKLRSGKVHYRIVLCN